MHGSMKAIEEMVAGVFFSMRAWITGSGVLLVAVLLLRVQPSADAAVVQITSSTSLTDAQATLYTNDDVVVDGAGVVLTLGAHGTYGVLAEYFFQSLTVTNGGKVLCAGQGTAPNDERAMGTAIAAVNVVVASGGSISADAQGFQSPAYAYNSSGTGPGAGGPGWYSGGSGGGGYGGTGGNGYRGGAGGAPYGSALYPTNLGSSAGRGWSGDGAPAHGAGGAIRITASNLVVEGQITANGVNGYASVGGGAGGSILVTCRNLSGNGAFHADGGAGDGNCGGGGGGRVAVYYFSATAFSGFTNSTASGGTGWMAGTGGSVGFINQSLPATTVDSYFGFSSVLPLDVKALNLYTGSVSRLATNVNVETLTLRGVPLFDVSGIALVTNLDMGCSTGRFALGLSAQGAVLNDGSHATLGPAAGMTAAQIVLRTNSWLVLEGRDITGQVGGEWIGAGGSLNVTQIIVDASSFISANGQGYQSPAYAYNSSGTGPGAGGPGWYSGGSGGGGYGGAGGNGYNGGAGGAPYGSALYPTNVGSSAGRGWSGDSAPAHGAGGAIRITVADLQLDGQVTADGVNGYASVGGGSGGSILVQAGKLAGSGLFSADGGNGDGSCGGGGGGRIAIYCGNVTQYTGLASSSVAGGIGWQNGTAGTLLLNPTDVQVTKVFLSGYALLLHADGTNGSTDVVDQAGHSCAVYGDTRVTTDSSRMGTGSLRFDGSGDYVEVADSPDFEPGSEPFTVDFWINPATTSPSGSTYLIGKSNPDAGQGYDIRLDAGRIKVSGVNGWPADNNIASDASIVTGAWQHVAVCATATNVNLFINGRLKGSCPRSSVNATPGRPLRLGFTSNYGGSAYAGLMDEIRYLKGVARWTTDFDPPSVAYALDKVDAGQDVTYRITVANIGALDADGVVVTDTLPANVVPSGMVTNIIGTLAAGSNRTFDITVRIDPAVVTARTNVVNITSTSSDADPANNHAEVVLNVEPIRRYGLTVTSAHGAPDPAGTTTNDWGALVRASVASPVLDGGYTQYVCTGWTATGSATNGSGTNTSFNITSDTTINWQWQTMYLLDAVVDGSGGISVTTAWYTAGSSVTVTATPDTGYHFVSWSGDTNTAINPLPLTMGRNYSLTAHFLVDSNAITTTAGAHGTISPDGMVWVPYGSDRVFTITPGQGYVVADVSVDGLSIGAVTGYTFTSVTNTHTIAAWFERDTSGGGDMDGDGIADLVWQLPSGPVALWFMNAGATRRSLTNVYTGTTSWKVRAFGDCDGDGISDLIWQLPSGQAACWLMNSNATVRSVTNIYTGMTSWQIRGAGDLDGDGLADLLWQLPTGQVACWLMNTNATLRTVTNIYTGATSWQVRGAGDVDADGVNDLVWQLPTGQVACWFMNTNGTRRAGVDMYTGTTPWQVHAVGDLDGDGIADLTWQLSTGQVACWFMNTNGTRRAGADIFTDATPWQVRCSGW